MISNQTANSQRLPFAVDGDHLGSLNPTIPVRHHLNHPRGNLGLQLTGPRGTRAIDTLAARSLEDVGEVQRGGAFFKTGESRCIQADVTFLLCCRRRRVGCRRIFKHLDGENVSHAPGFEVAMKIQVLSICGNSDERSGTGVFGCCNNISAKNKVFIWLLAWLRVIGDRSACGCGSCTGQMFDKYRFAEMR